jgi:hypothetical protein
MHLTNILRDRVDDFHRRCPWSGLRRGGRRHAHALSGAHRALTDDVLRGRISLPAPEKARIAATALTAKQRSRMPPDRLTATVRLVLRHHETA